MSKIKIVRSLFWFLGLTGVLFFFFYPLFEVVFLHSDLDEPFKVVSTEEKRLLKKSLRIILLEEAGNGRVEYLTEINTFVFHFRVSFLEMMLGYEAKIRAKLHSAINEQEKHHVGTEEIKH